MPSDLEAARRLYFAYDGSAFHMWHDGVDREYQSFNVPADVEAGWLRELTERYVAALDQPGNWKSVYFFVHHSDLRHLDKVATATPQGVFWEKCAFLEQVLAYANSCSVNEPPSRIHEVHRAVAHDARRLARGIRNTESVQRVERIKQRAEGVHRTTD